MKFTSLFKKENVIEIRSFYVFIKALCDTPLRLALIFFWVGIGMWFSVFIKEGETSLFDPVMAVILAPMAVFFSPFISGWYGLLHVAAIAAATVPGKKVLYSYQRWPEYLQLLALGIFVPSNRIYGEFAWIPCLIALILTLWSFSFVRKRFISNKRILGPRLQTEGYEYAVLNEELAFRISKFLRSEGWHVIDTEWFKENKYLLYGNGDEEVVLLEESGTPVKIGGSEEVVDLLLDEMIQKGLDRPIDPNEEIKSIFMTWEEAAQYLPKMKVTSSKDSESSEEVPVS